jgi:hypothetical protein
MIPATLPIVKHLFGNNADKGADLIRPQRYFPDISPLFSQDRPSIVLGSVCLPQGHPVEKHIGNYTEY